MRGWVRTMGCSTRRILGDVLGAHGRGALTPPEVEDALQAVDFLLHRRGQRIPGGGGIGEAGVAQREAVQDRHLDRIEHGGARRALGVAHVGMPGLARAPRADGRTMLDDVGDEVDLGAAVDAEAGGVEIELRLAEAPGEGDLALGRQRLVAQHDHAVPVERFANDRELVVVQARADVGSGNLRARGGRGGPDFNGHDCCLPVPFQSPATRAPVSLSLIEVRQWMRSSSGG